MSGSAPSMWSAVTTRRNRWLVPLVTSLAGLLLAGCGEKAVPTTDSAGSGSATTGSEWIVVAPGSATPSPKPKSGVTPTPTVGITFLTLPPVTRLVPSPTCTLDNPDFARMLALDVTPGTTSAKVGWFNSGGYSLLEYRVTATSQDVVFGEQRDIGWVVVKPTTPCGPVSVTVPNLDRKTRYVFSVDAVVTRRSGDGTHAATLFRSPPIATK